MVPRPEKKTKEMKRLYTDEDRYSEDADKLDKEADALLKPLMEKWYQKGYSIRDIGHNIISVIGMIECENVLMRSHEEAKKRQRARDIKFKGKK